MPSRKAPADKVDKPAPKRRSSKKEKVTSEESVVDDVQDVPLDEISVRGPEAMDIDGAESSVQIPHTRLFAIEQFTSYFPDRGEVMEGQLYDHIVSIVSGKPGWDFFEFRKRYKQTLQTIFGNLIHNTGLKKGLEDGKSLSEMLDMDHRLWEPELWPLDAHMNEEDDQEIREGAFRCSNCARKGIYARNTSHYEKQTRSADEPMTVFLHCHTCGKDYKFSS